MKISGSSWFEVDPEPARDAVVTTNMGMVAEVEAAGKEKRLNIEGERQDHRRCLHSRWTPLERADDPDVAPPRPPPASAASDTTRGGDAASLPHTTPV